MPPAKQALRILDARPEVVNIEVWTRDLPYEGLGTVRSACPIPSEEAQDLPEPVAVFRADPSTPPEATVESPGDVSAAAYQERIVRIRVRAPSSEGDDLPSDKWDTSALLRQIEAWGLDPEVASYALDPRETKQLRFGGKKTRLRG